jgi:hypothetical protein
MGRGSTIPLAQLGGDLRSDSLGAPCAGLKNNPALSPAPAMQTPEALHSHCNAASQDHHARVTRYRTHS